MWQSYERCYGRGSTWPQCLVEGRKVSKGRREGDAVGGRGERHEALHACKERPRDEVRVLLSLCARFN